MFRFILFSRGTSKALWNVFVVFFSVGCWQFLKGGWLWGWPLQTLAFRRLRCRFWEVKWHHLYRLQSLGREVAVLKACFKLNENLFSFLFSGKHDVGSVKSSPAIYFPHPCCFSFQVACPVSRRWRKSRLLTKSAGSKRLPSSCWGWSGRNLELKLSLPNSWLGRVALVKFPRDLV